MTSSRSYRKTASPRGLSRKPRQKRRLSTASVTAGGFMDFTGAAVPISDVGFASATTFLRIESEDLWTVLNVETHGYGFLADRRPLILFERHIFHKRTAR